MFTSYLFIIIEIIGLFILICHEKYCLDSSIVECFVLCFVTTEIIFNASLLSTIPTHVLIYPFSLFTSHPFDRDFRCLSYTIYLFLSSLSSFPFSLSSSPPFQVIMCSSAGVTRPSWSENKKLRYPGSADIPIVRLNPFNILNIKKDGKII